MIDSQCKQLASPLTRFEEAFSPLSTIATPHFYIAFSGGLDSYILLHATQQLFSTTQLTAIHINHGWHQAANQWEAHCQLICDQLKIPLIIENIASLLQSESYLKESQGPEEAARTARYAALRRHLKTETSCLLTGHHLEDQAETLLLQLMRGAGLQGLASMPLINPCRPGYHLRPLLTWTHKERMDYAQHYQLRWIEDSSNLNLRFRRNFIRHQVLPLLKEKWPNVTTTLARTATHCAQASALTTECAIQHLMHCQINQYCLSITELLKLSPVHQRNTLRYWLRKHSTQPLTTAQCLSIERLIHATQTVSQFHLKHLLVKRYRRYLYVLKPDVLSKTPCTSFNWDWKHSINLPYFGKLSATKTYGQGIRLSIFQDSSTINIRFRSGGERFRPNGRAGSHSLKKLYQEWDIPPWERPYIPLLYINNTLICVPGYAIAEHYAASSDEPGLSIQFLKCMHVDTL